MNQRKLQAEVSMLRQTGSKLAYRFYHVLSNNTSGRVPTINIV